MNQDYRISFWWDKEASVWIATSEDVYGLILEHESFDVLVNRVRLAIPELLAFDESTPYDISLNFVASRTEKLVLNG